MLSIEVSEILGPANTKYLRHEAFRKTIKIFIAHGYQFKVASEALKVCKRLWLGLFMVCEFSKVHERKLEENSTDVELGERKTSVYQSQTRKTCFLNKYFVDRTI